MIKTYSIFNESKTAEEWSRDPRCQVSLEILRGRLHHKVDPEQALTRSRMHDPSFLAFGETKTLSEWSKDVRCTTPYQILRCEGFRREKTFEEALTYPLCIKPFEAADYVGKQFGHIVVEKFIRNKSLVKTKQIVPLLECRCVYKNCNKALTLSSDQILTKYTCGCQGIEKSREPYTRHGYANNPLYSTWYGMHERCYNPKCASYRNYGGRGLTVDPLFLMGQPDEKGLLNFIAWAEKNPRPDKSYSLDRKNVDMGYWAGNLKWSQSSEQQKNKRNLRYFESKIAKKDSFITELRIQLQQTEADLFHQKMSRKQDKARIQALETEIAILKSQKSP